MNSGKFVGIDSVADERIWSESVYADYVSFNGKAAIMMRLCRYPEYNTSWLWVFCFLPKGIYGFTNNYLPCSKDITLVEEADVTYNIIGGNSAAFQRYGERDSPRMAEIIANVKAHRQRKGLLDMESTNLKIKGSYEPKYKPWRANKYRTEWIGNVKVMVKTDDSEYKLEGYGHWHEQHQKAPRWKTSFTYISLRGKNLSFVGTNAEENDIGWLVSSSNPKRVSKIQIGPLTLHRSINIHLEDNSILEGQIHTVYNYFVPVYNRWRPGTIVTAELGNAILT
ncbi:MAG: hypothetical protein ACFE8N_02955, partial [Promethearchaeota archaeon]